jgi:hypothetical protein
MADENDPQEARPAEQPAESRQEPPAGAQPPAGEQPPAPPYQPPYQPPAGPAPAPAGAWRGRARGLAGRRAVQLVAAGVAGAIIGGGAVALLDALDDRGEQRTFVVRMDRGGPEPFGPGWRRWREPEWDERGDFPRGWEIRPFGPGEQPRRVPPPAPPAPSASPSG